MMDLPIAEKTTVLKKGYGVKPLCVDYALSIPNSKQGYKNLAGNLIEI